MNIFILDDLDNLKEELTINKPKKYKELLGYLNKKINYMKYLYMKIIR